MARAHLLVVDDEPSILTTLQKALTLEGYAVDVAGGVRVAEEKLKKRTYDLCLFDVQLPDGDGVELLQRLRTAKVDVPVIIMSGHATIDTAVRATRLGALNFLEKYNQRALVAIMVLIYSAMRAASALRSFYFYQRIERLEVEARRLAAAADEGHSAAAQRKLVVNEVSRLRHTGEMNAYIDLLFLALIVLLCVSKIVTN